MLFPLFVQCWNYKCIRSLSAYLFGAFTIINIMGTRDITRHNNSSQQRGTVNHMFGLNGLLYLTYCWFSTVFGCYGKCYPPFQTRRTRKVQTFRGMNWHWVIKWLIALGWPKWGKLVCITGKELKNLQEVNDIKSLLRLSYIIILIRNFLLHCIMSHVMYT